VLLARDGVEGSRVICHPLQVELLDLREQIADYHIVVFVVLDEEHP
jgi:hypothetical protein